MGNEAKEKIYLDPNQSLEKRVADLISRMTLEEKVSQMMYNADAIPRLDIPQYNWWNECLHGVARAGRATIFPQAIGMAATFDEALFFRIATAISDEARAKYEAALSINDRARRYRALTFWTPNINIFRDPRWGRGQETYGEDPFLTGTLGAALVKGLQGDDPQYFKTTACAKHYAVHSGPEGDRHHFNAICSMKDLWETYLPAFKMLVDAGVEAVMGAYNRTLDEPCCASKLLLQDILRDKWQFKGHIVSDCWAIVDFHEHHKVTNSSVESAALAVNSGCNLNCGKTYPFLVEAVEKGLVKEETLDEALTYLFNTRFKLGMFDPAEMNPYSSISPDVINCDAHKALARETAAKSIVLLKNQNNALPLKKNLAAIYVIGPNANTNEALIGNYYGASSELVTILEGITGKASDATVVQYRHGFLLDREAPNPIDWATGEAAEADAVIAVIGINGLLEGEEGDAIASFQKGDRDDIGLPPSQVSFLKKLRENVEQPLIVVVIGGSPIAMPEVHELADAVLFAWYPGEQGGNAVADIIFGDTSPSGRLPVTFPKSIEQLPPYEDYSMKGRTYRYMQDDPLYPFGFGLSYAKFEYSEMMLSSNSISAGEAITATATVKNVGQVAAEEVVELFITDLEASVAVPLFSLKGFTRISLNPNENKKVTFQITPQMMEMINEDGESLIEPGQFKFWIGGSLPGKRSLELGGSPPVSAILEVR